MSYQGCPPNVQNELHGREATNDRSETALGGTKHQLQKYGRIGIGNAASVSNAKTNGYLRKFSNNNNMTKGMFHQFEQKMRECLLTLLIEYAPAPGVISVIREELDNKQREAKRTKEEMIETKSLEKSQESLVEALYYWEMYHSDVCLKGKQSIVQKNISWIKIRVSKIGSTQREYQNVDGWIGMEATCNNLVTQGRKEICG
jgi:hypothetical protein